MMYEKAYKALLIKICIALGLTNEEKYNAEIRLNNCFPKIMELRSFIEENHEEYYKSISYFFILYAIAYSSIDDHEKNNLLKSIDGLKQIEEVLQISSIKADLWTLNNDEEYINKYRDIYKLLINGIDKNEIESGSYTELIVKKYWKIVDSLNEERI